MKNSKKFLSAVLACCMIFTTAAPAFAADEVSKPSPWAEDTIKYAKSYNILPADMAKDFQSPISRADFCKLIINLIRERAANAPLDKILSAYGVKLDPTAFTDSNDENMLACVALKIISGVGDKKLEPNSPLTREMSAKILHNLAIFAKVEAGEKPLTFADEATISDWAKASASFVSSLADYDGDPVMGGIGENEFSPKTQLTLEQAVATIMRMRSQITTLSLPAVTLPEKILEKIMAIPDAIHGVQYFDEELKTNYGLSSDELVEFAYMMPFMITSSQEFLIAEVKPGKMEAVRAACVQRQKDVDLASGWYVDGDTIRNYKIVTNGNYIMFVMSRHVDEAVKIFNEMTK